MQNPRFRTDLVSKPVQEKGQRFVDVTDPDSGKTFRFYEVEYAVACAMNGDRDVVALGEWARSELGLEPSPTELETVISTLDDLGYLQTSGDNLPVDDLALGSPGRSPMDGGSANQPPPEQVELGVAGRSPMGLPPTPDKPEPADLELGVAGSSNNAPEPNPARTMMGTPAPQPAPAQAGPPAGDDVSTNLGEHLSIGTDDLKEAVRQSKIMEAVPVPAEMMQEMERQQQPAAPATPQPSPPPGATPIELPGRRTGPAPEPAPRGIEPPPPKPRGSNMTVILLVVLLVVAAGLAAYYFLVYAKDDGTEGTKRQRGAQVDEKPATPEKPAQVVATLNAGEVAETNLTAPKAGKVVWIEEAGTEVTAGAIVAKYDDFESVAKKLTAAVESRDRYKAKLEKAKERDDKRKMAKAAADVERKNGDIAELQDEAKSHVIKTAKAGVVSPLVEPGAVEEGQELVKLAAATGPSATFEAADPAKHEVGDKIEIAAKKDPSLTAICEITKVEGKSVSLTCPTDSGFEKGAAIIVKTAP